MMDNNMRDRKTIPTANPAPLPPLPQPLLLREERDPLIEEEDIQNNIGED